VITFRESASSKHLFPILTFQPSFIILYAWFPSIPHWRISQPWTWRNSEFKERSICQKSELLDLLPQLRYCERFVERFVCHKNKRKDFVRNKATEGRAELVCLTLSSTHWPSGNYVWREVTHVLFESTSDQWRSLKNPHLLPCVWSLWRTRSPINSIYYLSSIFWTRSNSTIYGNREDIDSGFGVRLVLLYGRWHASS